MTHCGDCVHGLIYGNCGMSPGNAACLYKFKRWWEEEPQKVIDYLERIKQHEQEVYTQRMAEIETMIETVRNYHHG